MSTMKIYFENTCHYFNDAIEQPTEQSKPKQSMAKVHLIWKRARLRETMEVVLNLTRLK